MASPIIKPHSKRRFVLYGNYKTKGGLPLGKTDTCTKVYISNPRIFADAFNYYFFHGKQVVKPEELTVQDVTEISLPYEGEKGLGVPIQKFRDVMKLWTVMTSSDATYMLLGIENQKNVHYAMPIRNMLYDALNYASQVEDMGKIHRELKDANSDEFLSGFKKTDKVKPVFTLVIYWGTKEWDGPRSLYEMLDVKEDMREFIKEYANDYKLHIIVPNEIENFEQFATDLGHCFRYIRSSGQKEQLKKLIEEYGDIYSDFDKISGYLLESVTNTKLPKSVQKEDSVNMCKAIEEMIEEANEIVLKENALETARNFLVNGASLELVVKSLPTLTADEITAIYKEVCGS